METIGRKYDFRKQEYLKKALKIVRFSCITSLFIKTRYYYFGAGHGNGFYNFPQKFTLTSPKETNGITDLDYAFSKRSDLWKQETIWNIELADALKIIKPDIAVFNNCNVNLFDSLYFYSGVFKYIIGTENYVNIAMFNLLELIQTIVEHGEEKNIELLARDIFNTSTIGFYSGGISVPGMKNASLFLIKLEAMPQLLKRINIICKMIILKSLDNVEWFKTVSKKIDSQYLSSSNRLVDLILVLEEINKELNDPKLNSVITAYKTEQEKMIVDQVFINKNPKNLSGVSIYLPIVDSEVFHIARFIEYYYEYKDRLQIFDWYSMLNILEEGLPQAITRTEA